MVAVIRREEEVFVPTGQTELRRGDRITIIGDMQGIGELVYQYAGEDDVDPPHIVYESGEYSTIAIGDEDDE